VETATVPAVNPIRIAPTTAVGVATAPAVRMNIITTALLTAERAGIIFAAPTRTRTIAPRIVERVGIIFAAPEKATLRARTTVAGAVTAFAASMRILRTAHSIAATPVATANVITPRPATRVPLIAAGAETTYAALTKRPKVACRIATGVAMPFVGRMKIRTPAQLIVALAATVFVTTARLNPHVPKIVVSVGIGAAVRTKANTLAHKIAARSRRYVVTGYAVPENRTIRVRRIALTRIIVATTYADRVKSIIRVQ